MVKHVNSRYYAIIEGAINDIALSGDLYNYAMTKRPSRNRDASIKNALAVYKRGLKAMNDAKYYRPRSNATAADELFIAKRSRELDKLLAKLKECEETIRTARVWTSRYRKAVANAEATRQRIPILRESIQWRRDIAAAR